MLEPHFVDSPPRPGATGATADVFSFGTVLWELLERKLPWAGSGPVCTPGHLRRSINLPPPDPPEPPARPSPRQSTR